MAFVPDREHSSCDRCGWRGNPDRVVAKSRSERLLGKTVRVMVTYGTIDRGADVVVTSVQGDGHVLSVEDPTGKPMGEVLVGDVTLNVDWKNKNARWDAATRTLHFEKCPRSFLGTDMPAEHPRTDCPFRSSCGKCTIPSGMRYLERMNGAIYLGDVMMCYLKWLHNPLKWSFLNDHHPEREKAT
jgi:hypothetical protein